MFESRGPPLRPTQHVLTEVPEGSTARAHGVAWISSRPPSLRPGFESPWARSSFDVEPAVEDETLNRTVFMVHRWRRSVGGPGPVGDSG